jgi:lipopolysaccharide assembly outer membrane protein LptD (OstA)
MFYWQHAGVMDQVWRFNVDYTKVSDPYYFNDFSPNTVPVPMAMPRRNSALAMPFRTLTPPYRPNSSRSFYPDHVPTVLSRSWT